MPRNSDLSHILQVQNENQEKYQILKLERLELANVPAFILINHLAEDLSPKLLLIIFLLAD